MDTSFSSYSRSFFKSITSESMGAGHPDKVADAISDAILDACLALDPESRVGCETLVKGNQVILAGEITTKAKMDYESIVRDTVHSIGYRTAQDDPIFKSQSLNVTNLICEQSPDIALGVDENKGEGKEQGAGDQGMMFGYACDETPELMPAPIMFPHRSMRRLEEVRNAGTFPFMSLGLRNCERLWAMWYVGMMSSGASAICSAARAESISNAIPPR